MWSEASQNADFLSNIGLHLYQIRKGSEHALAVGLFHRDQGQPQPRIDKTQCTMPSR